jgi:hypothetical protein
MSSLICTLFEGDYHLGVAGLVNSLVQSGYRGQILAGFRGELPEWAKDSMRFDHGRAHKRWKFTTGDSGCEVVFLQVETKAHFTNYKPHFMLQLLAEESSSSVERIFYFDPDIVVQARWAFLEEWADSGVALAEDVNSPLPENHPRRVAWRKKFARGGWNMAYRQPAYVNGGFLGLRKEYSHFLNTWRQLQDLVSVWVGGADRAKIGGGNVLDDQTSPNDPFSSTDQDALNASLELCPELPLSIIGQEAMGFKPGGYIMHHALGAWKPWRRRYIKEALGGRPPATADKMFWKMMVDGPIKPLALRLVRQRLLEVRFAAAIGRLIRRA